MWGTYIYISIYIYIHVRLRVLGHEEMKRKRVRPHMNSIRMLASGLKARVWARIPGPPLKPKGLGLGSWDLG